MEAQVESIERIEHLDGHWRIICRLCDQPVSRWHSDTVPLNHAELINLHRACWAVYVLHGLPRKDTQPRAVIGARRRMA